MENISITPVGIRREAKGLLAGNWSRALSALCLSLMTLVMFILINQLISSLMMDVKVINSTASEALSFNGLTDYYLYCVREGDFISFYISLAIVVFYLLIISPLNLGITSWYKQLVTCGNLQVGRIFYYYRSNRRLSQALQFELMNFFISLLIAIVSFLPSLICFGLAAGYSADPASPSKALISPLTTAGIALALGGLLLFVIIRIWLFLARYLYVGNHGFNVFDCYGYSLKHMKGRVGRVFLVWISLLGWALSCVLIFPAAYAIPYINTALAACAQDIIDDAMGDALQKIDEINARAKLYS